MKRLVCADIGIKLVKEEWKICEEHDIPDETCLLCPRWLDLQSIKTMSTDKTE